jgi:predicted AlkP superfamily pyrophosphatase or phosphodiesterase
VKIANNYVLFAALWLMTLVGCAEAPPRLVLFVTVDQLRGPVLFEMESRLEEGGFRHLLTNGTCFTNAHYDHANNETAVGHASLITGAWPARHGIIGNDWFDAERGRNVYNTEDLEYQVHGTQPKAGVGVSPRNMHGTTIGDELIQASAGRSRVFAASIKDRGAILPAGHQGKAFWFSLSSLDFISSTYYYDEPPEWLTRWNESDPTQPFATRPWALLLPRDAYLAGDRDDRSYEGRDTLLGRTFPHDLQDPQDLGAFIKYTPFGDELLLEFAQTLIVEENVGQGPATDFLALSFSSTDYVGHGFGPSSLEMEDQLFRLDRLLATLLTFIDERIGLDRTLIVLSSDHGAPDAPEWTLSQGIEAGRIPEDWWTAELFLAELETTFGRRDVVSRYIQPYLYLNLDVVAELGQPLASVERSVAGIVGNIPGIKMAVPSVDLAEGDERDVYRRLWRNYYPPRSGHLHIVQEPYWLLPSEGDGNRASLHGTPWHYDTHVPIIFAGPGIPSQRSARPVTPYDIAATLARLLGTEPPSASVGTPLQEVFRIQDSR